MSFEYKIHPGFYFPVTSLPPHRAPDHRALGDQELADLRPDPINRLLRHPQLVSRAGTCVLPGDFCSTGAVYADNDLVPEAVPLKSG